MADALLKQMKQEEKLAEQEISKAITDALNCKDTINKADEIHGICGGWPYPPTKDMLKLYGKVADKQWKKIKSGYSSFRTEISVNSPKNKPPNATVKAVFDGEWKGGESVMLRKGDTIASLSKEIYGFECYSDQVLVHNEKILGKTCKVLPAGFGLEFPWIWVPNWKNAPKMSVPGGAKVKAIKVKLPSMKASIDHTAKSAATLLLGNVIVTIDLEAKGELVAQKKGEMDASFSLPSYEAEIQKAVGPIEAGFKASMKGTSSGSLSLTVFNGKVKDLTFSGKLDAKEGAFVINMGTKKVKTVQKGVTFEGSVSLTAKIRIAPNPKRIREPVRGRRFEVNVSARDVAVVVVVVGVCAVGGWAVIAGAASAQMMGAGAAAGLAVIVGSAQ